MDLYACYVVTRLEIVDSCAFYYGRFEGAEIQIQRVNYDYAEGRIFHFF